MSCLVSGRKHVGSFLAIQLHLKPHAVCCMFFFIPKDAHACSVLNLFTISQHRITRHMLGTVKTLCLK